jgi:hypothetical protein
MLSFKSLQSFLLAFVIVFNFDANLISGSPISETEGLEQQWDLVAQVRRNPGPIL